MYVASLTSCRRLTSYSNPLSSRYLNRKRIYKEARDSIIQFQDAVLSHLTARGEADIEQLIFDIQQARSIPTPTDDYGLFTTTLEVCLRDLSQAGLIRVDGNGIWRPT